MTQQTDDYVFHLPFDAKPRIVIQWKYLFKNIFDYRWCLNKIKDRRDIRKLKKYFLKTKDYKIKEVYNDTEAHHYLFVCKDDNGNQENLLIRYNKETSLALWELVITISIGFGFVMK